MSNSRVRYIFTYGTLMSNCAGRQGAAERGMIEGCAQRVGPAAVRGRLFDAGVCPGAVLTGGANQRIRGEVWQLPDQCEELMAALDLYEGCGQNSPRPFPYVRRRVRVRIEDGRRITAWIYLWTRSTRGLRCIQDGRWREATTPQTQLEPLLSAACASEAPAFLKQERERREPLRRGAPPT